MFFANLGLGQFLALFSAISAISVVLYLLDRSRRRIVVSTLRFWVAAEQPTAVVRRKHIQQPFSLLLQLIGMLLLLLAIAQLRFGTDGGKPRRHVLILETSAWMNARTGRQTLMDRARERARAYLRAVPSGDMVMLVRADALATPATAFETNHRKIEQAIGDSRPSSTSLNLGQALSFARKVQSNGGPRGEIVFVGSGRVAAGDSAIDAPPNLRVLPVTDSIENAGIRKIGMKRSSADPGVWDIYVAVKNYGSRARDLGLAVAVAGMPVGSQRLSLAAGSEREASFSYRTRAASMLQARLLPGDAFPDDDRASVELPALQTLNVTVYSNDPDLLRPFLDANPRVNAVFRPAAQYVANDKGLVILDRFRPPSRPAADTIWIDPPAALSPVPIRARVENPESIRWVADNALGAGLRTRDVRLASASVFNTAAGDIKVAEVDSGPIIVARPGTSKTVVLGFHPALSAMRYELATPLLFANILGWIAPETFRSSEISAQSVGTVNVALDTDAAPDKIRVARDDGSPIPFTLEGRSLHFFSGAPGAARVTAGDRESVYSLSLPELGDTRWQPPATARRGLPTFRENAASSRDVWQIFALLGGACLLVEWLLYGRFSRIMGKARNLLKWPASLRKAS
jgi:von Willebrand factor type A domain/Aerotolerance regulator N-terminal